MEAIEREAKQLFDQNKSAELQELFNKELSESQSVELWRIYVKWLSHQEKETAMKGFDAALQAVGWRDGNIWQDVIEKYQTWISDRTLELVQTNRLLDKLRSIFHSAIATPTEQLTDIWNKYNLFENSRSGNMAHKFIADRSPIYMTARLAYKEMSTLMELINKYRKSFQKRKQTKYSDRDCLLIHHWKRYLKWESENPMGLEPPSHLSRLTKAYMYCINMMTYFPHFYVDAFFEMNMRSSDGEQFLRMGLKNIPENLTLLFILAHHLQISKKLSMADIAPLFEDCITRLTKNVTDIKTKYEKERKELSSQEAPSDPESLHQHQQMIEKMSETLNYKEKVQVSSISQSISLVYIMYMRMARREGEKAGRSVYAAARKSTNASYHVHIASALMEYHVSKDAGIAGRLFENALKLFNDDHPSYAAIVKSYMEFLISCNNDTNARALFERAVTVLPPELSKPIWESMLFYEHRYGDISVIEKLTGRYESILEEQNFTDKLQNIRSFYQYMDMDHVGKELGVSILEKYKSKVPKFKSALLSSNFTASKKDFQQFEDKDQPHKYPAMASVAPDRYPRPELSRWKLYKVDDNLKSKAQQLVASAPPPTPTITTTSTTSGHGTGPQVPFSSKPVQPGSPQVRSPKPIIRSPRAQRSYEIMLPPLIVSFLEKLPDPQFYNGPRLNVADMIQVFQTPGLSSLPLYKGDLVPAPSDLLRMPHQSPFQPMQPLKRKHVHDGGMQKKLRE